MYRLWQDAENRVLLIKELDKITGQVGIPWLFLQTLKFWFSVAFFLFCGSVYSQTYVIQSIFSDLGIS